MMLMTKAIENRFAQIGRQEDAGDNAIIVAKYFTPWSSWTWYCLEWDPTSREFFGLVDGLEVEFGYFSLDELASHRGPAGLRIERDLHWREQPIGEVRRQIDARRSA